MFSYIVRRLIAAVLIVFAASYLIYILAANAGDPLEELRGVHCAQQGRADRGEDRATQSRRPSLSSVLHLARRSPQGLHGNLDLGYNIRGQEVAAQVGIGIGQTVQLVIIATVLSILLGISIGMATALRQYSGFDYSVTFIAFVFFSLPVFWVAQILKMYVAIGFNNFLADPQSSRHGSSSSPRSSSGSRGRVSSAAPQRSTSSTSASRRLSPLWACSSSCTPDGSTPPRSASSASSVSASLPPSLSCG